MNHGSMKHCPDPETLAAWVDEGLYGDERARIERHAAGCARCQAHLAAMARMASADQPVVAPQPTPHLWRWLVPAAAGVTAVALWMLVLPPTRPALPTEPTQSTQPPVQSSQPAAPPPVEALENRARAADAVAAPELDARIVDQKDSKALLRQRAEVQERLADAREALPPRALPPGALPPGALPPAPPPPVAKESASMTFLRALPIEIVSPDPSKRWRVTRSVIERSTDSGLSWEAQRLEIAEHLTAGVAPSTSVVWVVGQHGAVLLTTDGQTWRRLPFPVKVDLVSVQATDATHATVTTFDGRTFSTADAATWAQR
jgi:hypothetical protein